MIGRDNNNNNNKNAGEEEEKTTKLAVGGEVRVGPMVESHR